MELEEIRDMIKINRYNSKNDVVILDHIDIIYTSNMSGSRSYNLDGLDKYMIELANIRKREKRNNTINTLLND